MTVPLQFLLLPVAVNQIPLTPVGERLPRGIIRIYGKPKILHVDRDRVKVHLHLNPLLQGFFLLFPCLRFYFRLGHAGNLHCSQPDALHHGIFCRQNRNRAPGQHSQKQTCGQYFCFLHSSHLYFQILYSGYQIRYSVIIGITIARIIMTAIAPAMIRCVFLFIFPPPFSRVPE